MDDLVAKVMSRVSKMMGEDDFVTELLSLGVKLDGVKSKTVICGSKLMIMDGGLTYRVKTVFEIPNDAYTALQGGYTTFYVFTASFIFRV